MSKQEAEKHEVENGRYAIEERLGITSRSAIEKNRLVVLCHGVHRCHGDGLNVPTEWFQEMKSLIESILARRYRNGEIPS